MSLSDFPVLFKADLILGTFQESPLNSITFQACANPGQAIHYKTLPEITFLAVFAPTE